MRLDRVVLHNFRIYKGRNEIVFDINRNNQNVSIISGPNGYGKTSLLTAIIWGLFGRLIGDVDERYRREVYDAGGYKKFASSNLNKDVWKSGRLENQFNVEIQLSEINIPSVPCNNLLINRTYNVDKEEEITKILIDGSENELTNQVGPDIFINDFILPREIAKFFLFDAEKIVFLSEIKTKIDKQRFSNAFSQVLGINKYEILRQNLENLKIKLRKKTTNTNDRDQFEKLSTQIQQLQKIVILTEEKINSKNYEIDRAISISDQYQEKLIREGNNISLEELIQQKQIRESLQEQIKETRNKIKELLEIAPFAIAGRKLIQLYNQILFESKKREFLIDNEFIRKKLEEVRNNLLYNIREIKLDNPLKGKLISLINNSFHFNQEAQREIKEKEILLDLTSEQTNEFKTILLNIVNSYSDTFRQIVQTERNNRILLGKTNKIISDAESKDADLVVKTIKKDKIEIDKAIGKYREEQIKLHEELGASKQELASKAKVLSELSKKVQLDEIDNKKDSVIERLISELKEFISNFKHERKNSLKNRLEVELQRLMHKKKYITNVEINLVEDIIEIELLDKDGKIINKENLSKGEQQLFATALLKSLVDESGIQFPIFIDSPLQKFDKKHARNIITDFYPKIARQVVLLPLLEKELSKKEYDLLIPFVNQAFVIINQENNSYIKECKPMQLFNMVEY